MISDEQLERAIRDEYDRFPKPDSDLLRGRMPTPAPRRPRFRLAPVLGVAALTIVLGLGVLVAGLHRGAPARRPASAVVSSGPVSSVEGPLSTAPSTGGPLTLTQPGRERRVYAADVSFRVPASWFVPGFPLTALSEPVELIAVSNFQYESRGVGDCAPQSLVDQLPADGVALYVMETRASAAGVPEAASARLGPMKAYECLGDSIRFDVIAPPARARVPGRHLIANLYAGPRATASAVQSALRVLQSAVTLAPAPAVLTGRLGSEGGPAPGTFKPLPGKVWGFGPMQAYSDAGPDGVFRLRVAPGNYIVNGWSAAFNGGANLCRATGDRQVAVRAGVSTRVDVVCTIK
jgi:hypothetical protein